MTPADILHQLQAEGAIPEDARIDDLRDVGRAAWSGAALVISATTRAIEGRGPAGYVCVGLRCDPTVSAARMVVRMATDGL